MIDQYHSAFRTEFLQLWKEYRVRKRFKKYDPKYWNKSVFTQKLRMAFLDIFGLKRLSDQELLEKLGYLEYSIRNDTRINQNLQYYTLISNQYKQLREEFELRLLGQSEFVSLDKAINKAKITLV